MAAVFPESMNRLDFRDTEGSLRRIDGYIRYMVERVEFANRGVGKVGGGGQVSEETLALLDDLAATIQIMQTTINGMRGELTGIENTIDNLAIDCGEWQG